MHHSSCSPPKIHLLNPHRFPSVLQPTDDIVLMALALEKTFLQKVAQLPQKEVEVFPHAAKGKAKKISAAGNELT